MRMLIFLLTVLLVVTGSANLKSQLSLKAFGGIEPGISLVLPSMGIYQSKGVSYESYFAWKAGVGLFVPVWKNDKKSLNVFTDIYIKQYQTQKEIEIKNRYKEFFDLNAYYAGLSAGIQYHIGRAYVGFAPYAAYMIHNRVRLQSNELPKQSFTLLNKGPNAINYFNYGVALSVGGRFPAHNPKFGARIHYPLSINTLYDDPNNSNFYNNRWFSIGVFMLEYYFMR